MEEKGRERPAKGERWVKKLNAFKYILSTECILYNRIGAELKG